jgi:CheY-like chemotaxis protein
LVDYHLPESMNGLNAIDALRATCGRDIPAALVTADGSDALLRAAREQGCTVLTKPLKPAALRAFLAAISTPLFRREPDVARIE